MYFYPHCHSYYTNQAGEGRIHQGSFTNNEKKTILLLIQQFGPRLELGPYTVEFLGPGKTLPIPFENYVRVLKPNTLTSSLEVWNLIPMSPHGSSDQPQDKEIPFSYA